MRFVVIAVLAAACGGRAATPTLPVHAPPTEAPAHDLEAAKPATHTDKPVGAAKDPRVIDLDIIRITAKSRGIGNEPELEHVATADLFKQANQAAKAGDTERAIGLYRRIVAEFPESLYAPVSLFDIAALLDARGDLTATLSALRDLVRLYPHARESVDGHLYIAALQADHDQWPEALATLDEVLARTDLTYGDRVEAFARRGYVLIEAHRFAEAAPALDAAVAVWRGAPHIDDPYYIAMASYYRGELAHRQFTEAPVRLPDDQLISDLDHKRVLAVQAYDRWKEALGFRQAYWSTASGYQMSQIFVELWEVTVKAPFPARIDHATRPTYVSEVHDRVREHLAKALEGHRMNVELAKAYGVETTWSKASEQRAVQIMEMLAKDSAGLYVTPE